MTAAESAAHLEALRTTGARPPLFLVHAMGGSPGCYRPLSTHMAERPIFGFRAARPSDVNYPLTTVQAMAAGYVQSLSTAYPDGIVHIAGWSMGGLIAFEMARLLRLQHRAIGAITMIDTWMRREHLLDQRSADHLRTLDFRRWRIHYKLVTGSVGVLENDSHPFWQLDETARLNFLLRAGREIRPERYAGNSGAERFNAEFTAYMLLRRASDDYRPQSQRLNLTFVTAESERDLESADVWKDLCNSVEVLVCTGSHLTIVDDPNAPALARLISTAAAAAESRVGASAGPEE